MHRTGLATALAAAGMATGMAASLGGASVLPPPAIPAPQPGVPASSCHIAQAPPAPWTSVYAEDGAPGDAPPSYELRVDAAQPCRLYRMRDPQSVDRSDDGGRSWRPVFHDSATGTAGSFAASALLTPARGVVALAERGNGDSAVVSDDAGARWSLMDGGLEGQPVRDIQFAPGFAPLRSGVAYAVTEPAACPAAMASALLGADCGTTAAAPGAPPLGLFVTRDGGRTWNVATLPPVADVRSGSSVIDCTQPCTRRLQMALDPGDASHLVVVINLAAPDETAGSSAAQILESHDYGTTFSYVAQFQEVVTQILVTRHGDSTRLYVVAPVARPQVSYSENGNPAFTPVGLPTLEGTPYLAADPADNDIVMVAGITAAVSGGASHLQITAYTTADGFDHVTAAPPLTGLSDARLQLRTPLDSSPLGVTDDTSRIVQADTQGRFYLAVDEARCVRDCAGTGPGGTLRYRQAHWRLDPHAATAVTLPPPPCLVSCDSGLTSTVGTSVQQELQTCAIPSTNSSTNDGPLTFDGVALLYPYLHETGPGPNQGVIHEMDPVTCTDAGEIVVDFDPLELAAVRRDLKCNDTPPYIGDMTYDQRRNVIWATLDAAGGANWSFCNGGLFQITVTDRSSAHAHGVARLASFYGGCNTALSYDYTDDSLWSCPGHIRASDGRTIPTCMPEPTYQIATWMVAPPKLYNWMEDDWHIIEQDDRNCRVDAVLVHRPYSEPGGENEQLACDPLTFGPDSRTMLHSLIAPTTVMWARDAAANQIAAYTVPAGACPLPTVLRYDGSPQVAAGATASVCAALQQRYPGGTLPLAQGITLTYDGVTDAGTAVRGAVPVTVRTHATAALSCADWAQTLAPGRYHITARFAGSAQYLPSSAAGTLHVLAPVMPQRPPAPQAILPLLPTILIQPPAQVPSVQPGAQAQPAAQQQIQAQSEAQAQSQTQSVAQLQPGVMAQRQRQRQVATSTVTAAQPQSSTLLAVARRPLALAGAAQNAAVLLALGLVCALPRPMLARARRARPLSRSPRTAGTPTSRRSEP